MTIVRPLSIDGAEVSQVKCVRDDVDVDCDVVMRTHDQTNSIAMSDPPFVAASHVPVTLMLTRLDYGNAVLVGIQADVRSFYTVFLPAPVACRCHASGSLSRR